MTVTSEQSKVEYTGDGVTVLFPIPYYFLQNTDIRTTLFAVDGTPTVLVQNVDFTVSGAGNQAGGSATLSVAPASPLKVRIFRDVPATQLTDYQPNDDFPAETHERALDKLTMLVQQTFEESSGTLKLHESGLYWDAEGLRIAKGADGINSTDFATMNNVAIAIAPLATKDELEDEEDARIAGDQSLQDQMTGAAGLVASQFSQISWHDQIIPNSVLIPPNKNAWSFGPNMTIAAGQAVTISPGSFWTIANGATTGDGTLTAQIPAPLDFGDV